ncbi:response regulator receiver protein [Chloroflexi bacterium TSY]|nr:response regulator receiver protein [Chloroflexi bacterium TSY]
MAESKSQALELLHSQPEMIWRVAVGFIDVVMESDSAGLELCQYIREEMDNKLTQLFIRTGQPGLAPERSVIDRYDINGYFTKQEATEDKLYSLVKSGVRQFLWARSAVVMNSMLDSFIQASSRDEFVAAMNGIATDSKTVQAREHVRMQWSVGNVVITTPDWDKATAKSVHARLSQQPGIPFGGEGDKFVCDDEHYHLVQVRSKANTAQAYLMFHSAFTMPYAILKMVHRVMSDLGILWHRL